MTQGWEEDLSPIGASDWTPERPRHLLDRAGFGGPPKEAARLAAMPPDAAVAWFIDFKAVNPGSSPGLRPAVARDDGRLALCFVSP
jgi:hypothetical protein